jgi:AcrR family transcriptional regulator
MSEAAARPDRPARPVKRGPGRPRAQPLEQQRRTVIEAAQSVFAQQGYHGATIEGVARRSGTPRPTVYELFGGKGQLYDAVLADAADRISDRMSRSFAESENFPLEAFVRHSFAAVFDLFEHDRDAVTVLLTAEQAARPTSTPGETRRRVLHQVTESTRARWTALGVDVGETADLMALMFFRMVEGLAVRYTADEGWDREAFIDLLTEFTVGGLERLWQQSRDVLLAAGRRSAPSPTDEGGGGATDLSAQPLRPPRP